MPNRIENDKKRNRSSELGIRVKTGEHIDINRTVIRALNNPAHLNFWWGEDEKVLLYGTDDRRVSHPLLVTSTVTCASVK